MKSVHSFWVTLYYETGDERSVLCLWWCGRTGFCCRGLWQIATQYYLVLVFGHFSNAIECNCIVCWICNCIFLSLSLSINCNTIFMSLNFFSTTNFCALYLKRSTVEAINPFEQSRRRVFWFWTFNIWKSISTVCVGVES